jgi:hypothetical protein
MPSPSVSRVVGELPRRSSCASGSPSASLSRRGPGGARLGVGVLDEQRLDPKGLSGAQQVEGGRRQAADRVEALVGAVAGLGQVPQDRRGDVVRGRVRGGQVDDVEAEAHRPGLADRRLHPRHLGELELPLAGEGGRGLGVQAPGVVGGATVDLDRQRIGRAGGHEEHHVLRGHAEPRRRALEVALDEGADRAERLDRIPAATAPGAADGEPQLVDPREELPGVAGELGIEGREAARQPREAHDGEGGVVVGQGGLHEGGEGVHAAGGGIVGAEERPLGDVAGHDDPEGQARLEGVLRADAAR